MTPLENNRSQDPRPVGAYTTLAHSFSELTVPGANTFQPERQHILRCDAFRVEYTTEIKGAKENVKRIAVIPSGPTGFAEGAYRLSPEPDAVMLGKITETINTAQKAGVIGAALLKDLLALENECPKYSWKPSQGINVTNQPDIEAATPVLTEFKHFVAHPKWLPHYGMKSTRTPETNWVSAAIQDETVVCIFRTNLDWAGEEPPIQSLKLKYSGPALSPSDHPSLIGKRILQGVREIMERARDEGALDTHSALLSADFTSSFLEPVVEPSNSLRESLRTPIAGHRQHTLSSGAITHFLVNKERSVAHVQIRAHGGDGAAALIFEIPALPSLNPEVWIADVSEAYRQVSSAGESLRLSGLYGLRNLCSKMEYKGANVEGLIGQDSLKRLLTIAAEFKILVGFETGPGVSISNMLSLCDGVQQVGFFLTEVPRMTNVYNDLALGFHPDGSLHFSAKNDVGGAFEGVLHKSMFQAVGDRNKAALMLVDAFGRQQILRERRAFEQVADLLAERDKDGYSHILAEGHSSYCSMPPSTDPAALRAYDLAASVVRGFSSLARIPIRASINYLEPRTCEAAFGYPGAPFDMSWVIKGDTITEVRFTRALPPHADSVRRETPVVKIQTNHELLAGAQGVQVSASLVLEYLQYAKECLEPRTAKPLSESNVYRLAHSLAVTQGV